MIDSNNIENHARRQFITFLISGQEFCADIMAIREIRGWTSTTVLPHAPEYVRGVINLRGTVLPVIDLKCRLGMGSTEATPKHVIIVAAVDGRTVGLLVDAVSDIFYAGESDVQPTPDISRTADLDCVEGIAVTDNRMISVIGMPALLAGLASNLPLAA
ncbi:MAG: chemotaxis protein CheW [Rhizomicrobium sp.]